MVSEHISLNKWSRWLILLGIVLPWLVFVGLAIAVRQSPQGIWQEQTLLWAIHDTANPVLDQLAAIVTAMGIYETSCINVICYNKRLTEIRLIGAVA
jgi:hypothetical protein